MVKQSVFMIAAAAVLASGCNLPGSASPDTSATTTATTGKYLYVASGTTYAGLGTVMATPSNTIVRYKDNGGFDSIVVDYSNYPGDTPVDMVNYDDNSILVLVENASGRRIDKVAKNGSGFSTFLSNSTALSLQLRSMFSTLDGGWIVSKGTMLEKFSSNKSRVLSGATAYVSAPAGACATSTTLISRTLQGPSGTIVYLHDAATPNNKIGLVKSSGYAVAADCLSSQTGPTVNHYPTAGIVLSTGRLLVAYSNTTGPVNEVYTYPISATAISAGTSAFNNASVLAGVTAFAEQSDGKILVASGSSTYNTIDQFTYDTAANTLAHVGTTAYISASVYTKSISSLLIAD
jgi:hypothetical protein